MKVLRDLEKFDENIKSIVTVGTFDGLHLGHLSILEALKRISKDVKGTTVLVTFEPHPRTVVSKNYELKMLLSFEEKEKLLNSFGIEHLIVITFTDKFANLTSDEFIKEYIVGKFNAVHMVVGHDHKFGKDRLGDEQKLKDVGETLNFTVTSVPAETVDGEIISSTIIRNSLLNGNVEKANQFLGRYYSFSGIIVKGAQRGRTLGFPTANLKLDFEKKVIPKKGVYLVKCECESEIRFGIMNIGYRPTFEERSELVIETHLLNFDRDIYGKRMNIQFLNRLRDEKKFGSMIELIHQIEDDKKRAIELINILVN